MKKILVSLFLLSSPTLFPQQILAAPPQWPGIGANPNMPARICDIETVVGYAITAIVALIGLATFITIIKGGFEFITSGGNAKGADAAKKTLTFAFAGLALLILSIFILRFIAYFTGVDVLKFIIVKNPVDPNCAFRLTPF